MTESPEVAIIQHESGRFSAVFLWHRMLVDGGCFFSFSFEDVMQVAHHYFENGIAYFTRRINKCISVCMSSVLLFIDV